MAIVLDATAKLNALKWSLLVLTNAVTFTAINRHLLFFGVMCQWRQSQYEPVHDDAYVERNFVKKKENRKHQKPSTEMSTNYSIQLNASRLSSSHRGAPSPIYQIVVRAIYYAHSMQPRNHTTVRFLDQSTQTLTHTLATPATNCEIEARETR